MISRSGEPIEGSSDDLMRDDVVAIVKVGATVPLSFSNEVTLKIPVDLPDGSVVLVYTSLDGNNWEATTEGVVVNGMLVIKTDHFTYFAVVPTDETRDVMALLEEVEATAEGFTDIIGHWAEDFINNIADLGIVSGKTEHSYAPNDNITRAELTKIATKAFGTEIDPSPNFTPFTDVSLNAWYTPYVLAARDAGIVEGISDGVFAPNDPITRAAALKIILGAKGFTDIDQQFADNYEGNAIFTYAAFPDVDIDAWFAKYVTYASDNGVIGGYESGNFGPGNSITRAEVSKIVVKVMEMADPSE